jgi:hypothetical protein
MSGSDRSRVTTAVILTKSGVVREQEQSHQHLLKRPLGLYKPNDSQFRAIFPLSASQSHRPLQCPEIGSSTGHNWREFNATRTRRSLRYRLVSIVASRSAKRDNKKETRSAPVLDLSLSDRCYRQFRNVHRSNRGWAGALKAVALGATPPREDNRPRKHNCGTDERDLTRHPPSAAPPESTHSTTGTTTVTVELL